MKKTLMKLEYTPLDDKDIKYYLPKARLLTYNMLSEYNSIDELLPTHKSYIIVLYPISSETDGHWVCITRFTNTIEYFSSYGTKPDIEFKWST